MRNFSTEGVHFRKLLHPLFAPKMHPIEILLKLGLFGGTAYEAGPVNNFLLSVFFAALQISAAQAMQAAAVYLIQSPVPNQQTDLTQKTEL